MNRLTQVLRRRNVRTYISAFVTYMMLAGQVAPLALASARGAAQPAVRAKAAPTAPAAPTSAAQPKPAPLAFAGPNIVATKTDSYAGAPAPAEPGQTITYTVKIENKGDAEATGITFEDTIDPNTTLVDLSVNTQPITVPDGYTASGNIPISVAAPGVLDNDRDPDTGNNSTLTVTEVQGDSTKVGVAVDTTAVGRDSVKGSVTLNSNGSFTYEPPPGYEGTDTFTYKAGDGAAGDVNTVTITISGMVWFINNAASGSSNRGTFSNPFTTIAAFNTANTGTAPNPKNGDFVVLRTGTGTYNEADGVNLRDQQKLIGEAIQFDTVFTAASNSSSAYTTFASAAGTAPNVTTTNGNGVDLAADNTVRGLNVGNTPGFFKINGGAVGSPTINTVNLTGTGGAINVATSGTFGSNVAFGTLESTSSPGANINLVGVTGTLGLSSAGSGLSGSAAGAPAVNVNGGTVSFTYPGNVTKSNNNALLSVTGGHNTGTLTFQTGTLSATNGTGLQFSNADGTYNFTGTTTLNGGDAGVDILSDSGGTFGFGTGTTITNPTGTAFNVDSSSPGVTYSGDITKSGTSAGRLVAVTNQGAATITFQTGTLSSTSTAGTGILLSNADGAVNFNGTNTLNGGDSGVDITAGSAGTFGFSSNTSITSPTGTAFDVSGTPGSPNVTYAGTITHNTANQRAVNVDGTTGGSISFTGTVTAGSTVGGVGNTGVNINAANGNVSFTTLNLGTGGSRMTQQAVTITGGSGAKNLGTVNIFTSAAQGIVATDSGAVTNNSDTSSAIDALGARAVNINGPDGRTPIDLKFATITTSGATDSISLVDVSGAKFQVTGTTQINTRTGRGVFVDNATTTNILFATVTIPNPSAAGGNAFHVEDSSSAVTVASATISDSNTTVTQSDDGDGIPESDGDGDAVFLKNNANGSFTLNGGTLSNCGNDCVDVRNSQNLTLSGVTINTPGVDSSSGNAGNGGNGILATNLTGTNTLSGITITNVNTAGRSGMSYINNVSTAATLTVTGSTFSNSTTGTAFFALGARANANMTTTIGGPTNGASDKNTFTGLFGSAINHSAGDQFSSTATHNITVRNNTFQNAPNNGLNTVSARNIGGGKANVQILNNTFDNVARIPSSNAGVITINGDGERAGNQLTVNVSNNTISNIGEATAAECGVAGNCTSLRAIQVFIDDYTIVSGTIYILNNNVTNVRRQGLYLDIGRGATNPVANGSTGSNVNAVVSGNTFGSDAAPAGLAGQPGAEILSRCLAPGGVFTACGKTDNVLFENNTVVNNSPSATTTATVYAHSEDDVNFQLTARNNSFIRNQGAGEEFMARTAFPVGGGNTMCLDMTGNGIQSPGTIVLREENGTTLNVEQASSAALTSANNGAAVTTPVNAPQFGVACATPPSLTGGGDGKTLTLTPSERKATPRMSSGVNADGTAAGPAAGAPAPQSGVTPMTRFVILPRATPAADAETEKENDETDKKEEAKEARPDEAAAEQPAAAVPEPTPEAPAEAKRAAPAGAPLDVKPSKRNGPRHRYAAEDTSAPLAGSFAAVQQGKTPRTQVLSSTPSSSVTAGTISVNIGTLAAGDSVTITFQVTVNTPYTGPSNVSNQGRVSGTNFTTVNGITVTSSANTDDPDTPTVGDPTLTPINVLKFRANNAKVAEPGSGSTPMLFTVTLSAPAPSNVTVQYATADGGGTPATGGPAATACDGTFDYENTAGTLTFNTGQRVKTVSVNVCADANSGEPNETLLLNLSNPSTGNIVQAQATGTILAADAPGTLIISELRTSGPDPDGGGPKTAEGNDFVELYNNTDSDIVIPASGFGLFKMGANCDAAPVRIATISNVTIPARRHYLLVGSGYGLENYGGTNAALGDQTLEADIESDANVAVFSTADLDLISTEARLDAVGFGTTNTGAICDLLREGTNLGPASGSTLEHTFFRRQCDYTPAGCTVLGNPKDTGNNSADFYFADTTGANISGTGQRLGAPGPENLASPVRRDSTISMSLLDSTQSSANPPNRVRDFTNDPDNNSDFGTLSIRRRVTNNHPTQSVTRLRFRVVELTTFPQPNADTADIRLRSSTSTDNTVTGVQDSATCSSTGSPTTIPCTVTLHDTTLEQPPMQEPEVGTPRPGGGYNATLTVTLGTPLAPNQSINVEFLLGIKKTGKFRFYIITEALP